MSNSAVEKVLTALRDAGLEPRPAGAGWSCRCPAHDDKAPSLSISEGNDGRALAHCHAGCTPDSVLAAIGMKAADLFPPRDSAPPKPAARSKPTQTFPTADAAVAALSRTLGMPTTTWMYRDAAGDEVGAVVRWDTQAGKVIRPVSRTAAGWIIGAMPEPRPVYNLDHLAAADPETVVYIVEGEKCADAATACGLLAVTSAGGAKAAGKTDWTPLAGYKVVVLPDHDVAGDGYAKDVSRLALAAGALSVKIARLANLWPDMPVGGDIADYLDHRDSADAETIRAEIEAMADAAEPIADAAPNAPVPFPIHVLPAAMKALVEDAAVSINCDPILVALPALIAAAGSIGGARSVEINPDWTEPCILWGCLLADSGSKKSPAAKAPFAPLERVHTAAMKEHDQRVREWESANERVKLGMKAWKKSGGQGEPPAAAPKPVATRCKIDDATVEVLAPILCENPRGVVMRRDELAGMVSSMDRYATVKGGDQARWLSIYDGDGFTVDRKTGTPRTISVPAARVSVFGGCQPGIFFRIFGQEQRDAGLLARFLIAWPERRSSPYSPVRISIITKRTWRDTIEKLLALEMEVDEDGEPCPGAVLMSDAAHGLFVQFHNEIDRDILQSRGSLTAALAKAAGVTARIALVFHLVHAVNAGLADSIDDRISAETMQSAIDMARFFISEARRVYDAIEGSGTKPDVEPLPDLVRRFGGSLSPRELVQRSRKYPDVAAAESALDGLVKAGHGAWEQPPQQGHGGPKARRFTLNP